MPCPQAALLSAGLPEMFRARVGSGRLKKKTGWKSLYTLTLLSSQEPLLQFHAPEDHGTQSQANKQGSGGKCFGFE